MNILPLVFLLLLILSALTVENMEKFKAQFAVQHHYQTYLAEAERQSFNERQLKLKKQREARTQRQLSFTYFFDTKLREASKEKAQQMRLITVELIKELYAEASFYKKLEAERPNFVEELLDEVMASADNLADNEKIRRIEDVQRLKLASPDLQEAFYRMLKGTKRKTVAETDEKVTQRNLEKGYYSLLTFIKHEKNPKIAIHLASRELLKAIYGSNEIANAILQTRKELKKHPKEGSRQFNDEFKGKQRPEIKDDLLEFKITSGVHPYYD
jgi:hypothetical protein